MTDEQLDEIIAVFRYPLPGPGQRARLRAELRAILEPPSGEPVLEYDGPRGEVRFG